MISLFVLAWQTRRKCKLRQPWVFVCVCSLPGVRGWYSYSSSSGPGRKSAHSVTVTWRESHGLVQNNKAKHCAHTPPQPTLSCLTQKDNHMPTECRKGFQLDVIFKLKLDRRVYVKLNGPTSLGSIRNTQYIYIYVYMYVVPFVNTFLWGISSDLNRTNWYIYNVRKRLSPKKIECRPPQLEKNSTAVCRRSSNGDLCFASLYYSFFFDK